MEDGYDSLRELGNRPGYGVRVTVNAGLLIGGVALYAIVRYPTSSIGAVPFFAVLYGEVVVLAMLFCLPGALALAGIPPRLPRVQQRALAIGGCAALLVISGNLALFAAVGETPSGGSWFAELSVVGGCIGAFAWLPRDAADN